MTKSIIETPSGVIKAKTLRRLLEDQRWCAEEVLLNIRGIPSNPVPGAGGDHIPTETNGTKHAERGEDEHARAREAREVWTLALTVAAPDPTVRRMYTTKSHIREYGATDDAQDARGLKRADQCRTTMSAR